MFIFRQNVDSSLYVQCLGALLRLPVHQTENNFMELKEQFADETNRIFFASGLDWRRFMKDHLRSVSRLRHALNLLYPLLLRSATFPKAAVREMVLHLSLLIDLMTGAEDGGGELDEEALFEVLEIGLYVIYLLTKSEKEIVVSSVAGSLMPVGHIQYKDLFIQLIANPPNPTVGLAALLTACELDIYAEIATLKLGASRCLANLTVIVNRPPTGILDGIVKTLLHSIRSCSLSTLISIVTDEPVFTLLWHRTAHLLKLHLPDDSEVDLEWILFSAEGLKSLISLSLSIFSRESYCCIQYLADTESVLLLTIAKLLTPAVHDQIARVNPHHADSILRDCVLMLSIPFAVDLDEASRVAIQQCYSHFNFIGATSRFLHLPVKDEKLFEITLGFVTRSVLSNPVHMTQMEMILMDLAESINGAITNANPIVAADALAVINQYLLIGNVDLALTLLREPNPVALTSALKNPR